MNKTFGLGLAGLTCLLSSCATVEVKPIKVEPIHVVVDVNVRVERQLDQFFAFEDQSPGTQPSTIPTTVESAASPS